MQLRRRFVGVEGKCFEGRSFEEEGLGFEAERQGEEDAGGIG